jgi:hypothetical protein
MKNLVGRKKTNFQQMPARFPDGTFERIDAVLEPNENRTDFLRVAVEREVDRRERAKDTAQD